MPFQGEKVHLSGPAAAALGRGILVTINTAGEWAATSAGLRSSGVTLEEATAQGDVINVAALNGARLEMQAGAAIATAGLLLASNATGQAVPSTATDALVGVSISAVAAANEIVDVVTSSAGGVSP